MSERKRRADKDRHEFAWNPDFGWQILRRCPNYKKAVETFISAAKRAGDQDSLDAFKVVSLDESKKRAFASFAYKNRMRGTKGRKELLRDQDVVFNFPLVRTFQGRAYDAETRKYFEIDTTTKHYQRFYKWYGDLLLFPIDPSSILPRIEGLSSLWSLYTVKIHEGNLPIDADLDLDNDRLIRLTLTINTSFSKSVIEDDLRRFIRSRITREPMTSRKFCYQLHLSFLDRKRDLIWSKSKWRWRPSTERAVWPSRVVVLSPFLA